MEILWFQIIAINFLSKGLQTRIESPFSRKNKCRPGDCPDSTMVDGKELESLTPCTSSRCSTSWANRPTIKRRSKEYFCDGCYYKPFSKKKQEEKWKNFDIFLISCILQVVLPKKGRYLCNFVKISGFIIVKTAETGLVCRE